jgi:hypothetical protein
VLYKLSATASFVNVSETDGLRDKKQSCVFTAMAATLYQPGHSKTNSRKISGTRGGLAGGSGARDEHDEIMGRGQQLLKVRLLRKPDFIIPSDTGSGLFAGPHNLRSTSTLEFEVMLLVCAMVNHLATFHNLSGSRKDRKDKEIF